MFCLLLRVRIQLLPQQDAELVPQGLELLKVLLVLALVLDLSLDTYIQSLLACHMSGCIILSRRELHEMVVRVWGVYLRRYGRQ